MRWQPIDPVCVECGFNWDIPIARAVELIVRAPSEIEALVVNWCDWRRRQEPGTWSSGAYLWHLVDVLRIGAERLWVLQLDPDAGLRCWDADALAEVRQYSELSPRVGLEALVHATTTWSLAAEQLGDDAVTTHPRFGELTRSDIVRRNAHEVAHHLLDIRRALGAD